MRRPKPRYWLLLGGIAIGIFGSSLFFRGTSGSSGDRVEAGPILLAKIQKLGQLRTARYNYENVFDYSTSRRAAEWATYIPGADSLVQNSTTNTALVSATGTVDAGVDLSLASFEDRVREGKSTRVLLIPPPQILGSETDAKVNNAHRGVFWVDSNIALKARRDAGNRFRDAAVQQGILKQARENALASIHDLLEKAGASSVLVEFKKPGPA